MKDTTIQLGIITALSMTSHINAATIVAAGSVLNDSGSEVTAWRTATTTKSADIDGDNIYGTFGGIAFGDNVFGAMDFISAQTQVGPFSGYANIDNIAGTGDRQVKTTTNGAVAGTDIVMYTFELNTAVAASETLRVGVATDGLNGAQFAPASIGLVELGAGGGSAEVSTTGNATIDMYFFDVTGGVAAGTQFQVIADSNASDFVTHQFVTLDLLVPEPSSVALLGLSGLALLRRRRK